MVQGESLGSDENALYLDCGGGGFIDVNHLFFLKA